MVPVGSPLAASIGRELADTAEFIRREATWPSPETAFAAHLLDRFKETLGPELFSLCTWPQDRRLDEAPILAATGYILATPGGTGGAPNDWVEGLKRLSGRDPFPVDRMSFAYRPVELLGICLGVTVVGKTSPEAQWLRGVVEKVSRDQGLDPWTNALHSVAANTLGLSARLNHDAATVDDLSVLRWAQGKARANEADNVIDEESRRQDRDLLWMVLGGCSPPSSVAHAAVRVVSVTGASRRLLESEAEANWQVGRGERDATELVVNICRRFPLMVRQLGVRQRSREGFRVEDEYDVQDLMHALLRLHFDDVRPEEHTPSYAGKHSRMDFLLKKEQLVLEAKMTRKDLGQREVVDELAIDEKRYRAHPDCRTLVCFVYDPEGYCQNPAAIERDAREEGSGLNVVVVVSPQML